MLSGLDLVRLAINCEVQTNTLHAWALKVWPNDIMVADMLSFEIIFLRCIFFDWGCRLQIVNNHVCFFLLARFDSTLVNKYGEVQISFDFIYYYKLKVCDVHDKNFKGFDIVISHHGQP